MGETVTFPCGSALGSGYLAAPDQKGPGVIVIQEWWGLVDHIKDVADRLSDEGFLALAPDLFHGKRTTEPDEAAKMLMELKREDAARDLNGAVDYLRLSPMLEPNKIGCVGFCAGGSLALVLATHGNVDAAVTFYGIPADQGGPPNYSAIKGPILGHFADGDDWASPQAVEQLSRRLEEAGVAHEFHSYAGTDHAFFNNDRPEVYNADAAQLAWTRTLDFFRQHLT